MRCMTSTAEQCSITDFSLFEQDLMEVHQYFCVFRVFLVSLQAVVLSGLGRVNWLTLDIRRSQLAKSPRTVCNLLPGTRTLHIKAIGIGIQVDSVIQACANLLALVWAEFTRVPVRNE